jgi:hypothetical protein
MLDFFRECLNAALDALIPGQRNPVVGAILLLLIAAGCAFAARWFAQSALLFPAVLFGGFALLCTLGAWKVFKGRGQ